MEENRSNHNGFATDSVAESRPPETSTSTPSIPQSLTPRRRPTFATPLLQSNRSQTLQWSLPRPFHQHTLVGRSRAAWHTSFLVPSLNTVLDAGLVIDDSRPQNVFITHGHSDHSFSVMTYCRRISPPDIYIPTQAAKFLDDYILSSKSLNLGFRVKPYHNFDSNGTLLGHNVAKKIPITNPARGNTPENVTLDTASEDDDEEDPEDFILPTHRIVPVSPESSETIPLKTLPSIVVATLPRAHTVPSVGYLFIQTSNKLKTEYKSLAGPELKVLRQSGIELTYCHKTPIFAFLGDGDHTSLLNDPSWLVGDEAAGVSHCPTVITECSFLYESHREQAVKTKHTLWSDLEPIIRRHQRTTWVLMHFSKRYSDETIVKFFENLEDCPPNIVVWVDGGNEIISGEHTGKKVKVKGGKASKGI
ncbi:hypothetical protein ABW19_dt0203865 [Dactylella cylindrospora]|nr:hypothetical protein ABW19_dt0203865 [Dactylella cylindrospora]